MENIHSSMKTSYPVLKKDLCSDCKKLGYCRLYGSPNTATKTTIKKPNEVPPIIVQTKPKPFVYWETIITENHIANWVPIRARVTGKLSSSGKKIQQAHELFHQHEFEHASYIYRDLLEGRNDYHDAWLGLAVSFFFMQQYEEATVAMQHLDGTIYDDNVNSFLTLCSKKAEELALAQQQAALLQQQQLEEDTLKATTAILDESTPAIELSDVFIEERELVRV